MSHIYNLRKSKFTKTQATKVKFDERCKPRPNGEPGHLRVDSVHRGDMDGKKGVYHVNATDEVSQWEIVVTLEHISAQFMPPDLSSLLEQFPFLIKGFHANNGSEHINRKVAGMLNELIIRLTKPRRSNDNALAESKNNAVVRKMFGYIHIPQENAKLMEQFNQRFLNPCITTIAPAIFRPSKQITRVNIKNGITRKI
ncbi:MAG: hypothetical protein JKY87_05570 [Mariprofundus sp.]|nr:hypothetical protein [Mariprofundus sp.]